MKDLNCANRRYGKQLGKVGRLLVNVNNKFLEEPDVDVTLFQVTQTSGLGNLGTDSILTNEENSCQENDVQLTSFQWSQSTELGNAGTSSNTSDDIDLENELGFMDYDAFYKEDK